MVITADCVCFLGVSISSKYTFSLKVIDFIHFGKINKNLSRVNTDSCEMYRIMQSIIEHGG